MGSSIQIEERAAEWLARRDSGEWSESDEARFNAWLEQSTLHVVAFVRLESAWNEAKRLKALSAGVQPGTVPSPQEWQLTRFFGVGTAPAVASESSMEISAGDPVLPQPSAPASIVTKRWTVAASLLIAIAASIAWYSWLSDSTYRTPVGGIAQVPMSDGSQVTLNTDSKIRLAFSQTERRVELQQGEAFFEVAKDPQRPFVVAAGDKRVVAVGTRFSVRRDADDVRVFITEGEVRIDDAAQPPARNRAEQGEIFTLSAGSVAHTSDAGVLIQEKTVREVEGYLSWRTGHLIFRDSTLAEAVAEFNRYNTRKVVIEDPAVAAIRVSGKFRSTQLEAFVRLMENGFSVRAQRVGDRIVLTERRKAAGAAKSAKE